MRGLAGRETAWQLEQILDRGPVSLEHILLGLRRRPSSGYDLKQGFDVAICPFRPAEPSQVYPALKQLERRRLLRSPVAPAKRGPRRRVYHTTAAGRAALRRTYVVCMSVAVFAAFGGWTC